LSKEGLGCKQILNKLSDKLSQMSRIKGSKNRYPAMEARITIRLPEKLLRELEKIAAKYGQNRSEAILEALRDHVKRG
tara:strand:- start:140 stop:373 length:234 start_codon:yes stop_codon:yes gene_type:complete